MTRSEEQETQVIDPGFDILDCVHSSPPSSRSAGQAIQDNDGSDGHINGDATLTDANLSHSEPQHNSLLSHGAETQFGDLEHDTQHFDDPASSFENTIILSPSTTTSILTTVATSPLPITIERPKDVGLEDGASGFRYGKAKKALVATQFERHPGKPANANATRSTTSPGEVKQNSLHHARPIQQIHLPAKLVVSEPILPSSHSRVPLGSRNQAESPINLQPSQVPTAKPKKETDRNSQQQRVSRPAETDALISDHVALLRSPTKETRPPSHQSPFPQKSISRVPNKSNERSGLKQPFPEVSDLPPTCRMNSAAPSSRLITAVTDYPVESANVNGLISNFPSSTQIPEIARGHVNRDLSDTEVSQTTTDAQSHQHPLSSVSQSNPRVALPTAARNNFDRVEASGIQVDPLLAAGADAQSIEKQQELSQTPAQLEQVFVHKRVDNDGSTFPPMETTEPPAADANPANLFDHTDGERLHSFNPSSQPPSRPHSSLSNTARAMVRPLVPVDLLPQGVSESAVMHFKHSMKVQKPLGSHRQGIFRINSNLEAIDQRQSPTNAASSLHLIIQNLPLMQEVLNENEEQKGILDSQQTEIEKLRICAVKSRNEIERLEGEKVALTTKVKRFTEISAAYKAHMNDVVLAQKHLMAESSKIKAESAKIREESKATMQARSDRVNHEQKLRSLISGAQNMFPTAKKLEEFEKTNQLLQSELDARMLDLGRERHNTEHLQKCLNAQVELHHELVDALKKAQLAIADELTKDGSVLASIVQSENSVQAKIDELSTLVNMANGRELELPSALVKLVEDLHTRIEDKLQAVETKEVTFNDSSVKRFEDLKRRINQLCLDEDTKVSLNGRISELRESNIALVASGSARELECQSLAERIDELGRELSACRGQLTIKSDELAALHARPTEDPVLRSKIHDLESANSILQGQADTANEESSKVREELVSCQEMTLSAQEHSRELQGELTEAQTLMKSFVEDKKKYLATHKSDIEKARQEIAKTMNNAKTETNLLHSCLVKNLEQRRSEAERELSLAQEELRRGQEERASYSGNLNKLQEELLACKKQIAHQSASIKRMDERNSLIEQFERREGHLQQVLTQIAEAKSNFDTAQNNTSQKIEVALANHQKESETLIEKVDTLEKEKALLEEQRSQMQKYHNATHDNNDHNLGLAGPVVTDQFVDQLAASIPAQIPHPMGPPTAPTSKLTNTQRPFSARSDFIRYNTVLDGSRAFSDCLLGTPEAALSHNESGAQSATQRISGILNSKTLGIHTSKSESTPSNSHDFKLKVMIGSKNSAVAQSVVESSGLSPNQTIPRAPLRPANRKSSDPTQQARIKASAESANQISLAMSYTPESSIDNPRAMPARSSTDTDVFSGTPSLSLSSLSSSNLTQHERNQNQAKSSHLNAIRNEEGSMNARTPTKPGSPVLILLSPETGREPSPVDQVEYYIKEVEMPPVDTSSTSTAFIKQENTGRGTSMHGFAENTVAGVKFHVTPTSRPFSGDVGDLSGVNTAKSSRPPVISTKEEAARRRQTFDLKSALRISSKTQKTNNSNNVKKDVYDIPVSTPVATAVQSTVSRIKTTDLGNKQPAPARTGSVGSTYNRIVGGFKADSGTQVPTTSMLEDLGNSPMYMPRKRPASLSNVQPPKSSKRPRVSIPHQGRKNIKTPIPDSQERRYRY